MIERKVLIQNKLGLHARASASFVGEANRFPCYVGIKRDNLEVNGKSIMGVMMLAASIGTELVLIAQGEQEEEAIATLELLVNQRFGEAE